VQLGGRVMARGRILVVDDDQNFAQTLAVSLRDNGYEVTSACDEASCMACVRRDDPDLVLLDLGTPSGHGFLTLERLCVNPHWERLPVVVVATKTQGSAPDLAMRAGASAYFESEGVSAELLETISRLVADSRPHIA
jgi:DNA-binding response OmpR family regulator